MAKKAKQKTPGKGAWKVMDRSAAIASGLIATRVSTLAWRTVTGKKPPTSGQHPEVGTREAVLWAMVGGALVELVKVGTRRAAAQYWVKSTGNLPPGVKPLFPDAAKGPVVTEQAPLATSRKSSRRSRGK
jgi:hypothetical protein